MTGQGTAVSFPAQKKTKAQKGKTWRRDSVNGGIALAMYSNGRVRQTVAEKRVNYDLHDDVLDQRDVEKICNPHGIMGMKSAGKIQNYPISNPKIDLLVGEALKRSFDVKVRVSNDDAISDKEQAKKQELANLIIAHATKNVENPEDEEAMAEELKNFKDYMDFEYQDSREKLATQVLNYLVKHLNMQYVMSEGFRDALICAEEIYMVDIVGGEPVMKKLNPKFVHTARSGESDRIEDSDVIVVEGYMSPGQIIDEYHDELSSKDISRIETGFSPGAAADGYGNGKGQGPGLSPESIASTIDLGDLASGFDGDTHMDSQGNIKIYKVYWKSMRKILEVTSFDEFGDEVVEHYDEDYKIDRSIGETQRVLWISEWWEGHKIGGYNHQFEDGSEDSIYLKMRPKPVQFRRMENPSLCHPGIVGTIYNTNGGKAKSFLDRCKPLQYLYNVLAFNAEVSIAKNLGKIMRLDLASVPDGWNVDQWMSYAQGQNLAVYDSFKEGNKGASMGKIAGANNSQAPVIDLEMGNTIQLYMNMMQYIKQELSEITGISRQRQGGVSTSETVGGVERSVTQSSHITEFWFARHDQTKKRLLEVVLQTAKHAWSDKKNKKVQYVLDDGADILFNIDGEQFNEAEYGLQIVNASNVAKLMESMRELAHAGIQNDQMKFSQLLDIYMTDSISSIRRKIVRAENEKMERDAEAQKQQAKMHHEQIAANEKLAESAQNFKREEWAREDERLETQIEGDLAQERMRQDNEMSDFHREDTSHDASGAVDMAKLRLQADKIDKDYRARNRQMSETERHNKVTEGNDAKKIVESKKKKVSTTK